MTKEVLDIKLAGIDPNRPGSKRVAEAMGVDLANPSPHAVTSEHNVHVMIAKHPAVEGLKEVARSPAPKVVQVCAQGIEGYLAYRRPALLTPLAMHHAHTPLARPVPIVPRSRVVATIRAPSW